MYLMIFKNPHNAYKELSIPFWALDDEHAQEKLLAVLKIWFDNNTDYIKGSIVNGSTKLFNMKEVKINVPN